MSDGPHGRIASPSAREQLLATIFDRLWSIYRRRVPYVQRYEQLIAAQGGTFVNDHIAFRTLAGQQPYDGLASVSRPFEALGYWRAGCYHFPDKHLSAIHLQHPNGHFPKLFISELQTWQLGETSRGIIERTIADHCPPLSNGLLRDLQSSRHPEASAATVVHYLETLPWPLPSRIDVETLNRDSQYAAWVLVHGYNVNHFTALINSQGPELNTIDATVAALRSAGVPMKSEIEGEPGSRLRQTATEAVMLDVPVAEGTLPWSYAISNWLNAAWSPTRSPARSGVSKAFSDRRRRICSR